MHTPLEINAATLRVVTRRFHGESKAATGPRLELRRGVDAPAVAPFLSDLRTLTANSGGTGKERAALRGRERPVAAVHHAPDGGPLAGVDSGGEVRIWDVAGTCHAVTRAPNTSVRACGYRDRCGRASNGGG